MLQGHSRSVRISFDAHALALRFPTAHVKLGICGPVAKALSLALDLAHGSISELVAHSATHDAQAFDVARQVCVLLKQQPNVCQGASGHEPCGVGPSRNERAIHGLEVVDVSSSRLDRLWQQRDAVEAALAVDVGGMHCVAHNWLRSARVDLYITAPQSFEDGSRVECRLVEGGIAVDGAGA